MSFWLWVLFWLIRLFQWTVGTGKSSTNTDTTTTSGKANTGASHTAEFGGEIKFVYLLGFRTFCRIWASFSSRFRIGMREYEPQTWFDRYRVCPLIIGCLSVVPENRHIPSPLGGDYNILAKYEPIRGHELKPSWSQDIRSSVVPWWRLEVGGLYRFIAFRIHERFYLFILVLYAICLRNQIKLLGKKKTRRER